MTRVCSIITTFFFFCLILLMILLCRLNEARIFNSASSLSSLLYNYPSSGTCTYQWDSMALTRLILPRRHHHQQLRVAHAGEAQTSHHHYYHYQEAIMKRSDAALPTPPTPSLPPISTALDFQFVSREIQAQIVPSVASGAWSTQFLRFHSPSSPKPAGTQPRPPPRLC